MCGWVRGEVSAKEVNAEKTRGNVQTLFSLDKLFPGIVRDIFVFSYKIVDGNTIFKNMDVDTLKIIEN